jgi:membrane fusion protein (multidrug efflux system)
MEPMMSENAQNPETPQKNQPETPAPRGRKRLAAGILLLVLAAGGGYLYLHYRNRVSTDDAQVDGHLLPVASKVYGSVERILVEDNQPVKAGDLLVQIDPRDLQSRVDQAQAALSEALAQVQGATADGVKAKASLDQASSSELQVAQANLDARKATLDKAKADLQRAKPLADRQEISAQEFDHFRTSADVAESEWNAAQRRLASVRQEAEIRRAALGAQTAKVGQTQAGVEAARANLAALKLQLGYTRIVAPVAGVVTRKTVELGQIVQPGQGLLTLVPLDADATWVTANFKETQLTRVHPGQAAEVTIDMNGQTIRGTVDSIAGSTGSRLSLLPPENAVGNFVKVVQRIPVKIKLDPEEAAKVVLRPGMNVDATILTSDRK